MALLSRHPAFGLPETGINWIAGLLPNSGWLVCLATSLSVVLLLIRLLAYSHSICIFHTVVGYFVWLLPVMLLLTGFHGCLLNTRISTLLTWTLKQIGFFPHS